MRCVSQDAPDQAVDVRTVTYVTSHTSHTQEYLLHLLAVRPASALSLQRRDVISPALK